MTRHIAIMRDQTGNWIDVFYNAETKQAYQSYHPSVIVRVVAVAGDQLIVSAMLEQEFGSNIELD